MSYLGMMERIWETKEKLTAELHGMTHEEMLRFFAEQTPTWARSLPKSCLPPEELAEQTPTVRQA
ncbi:MAG: hypothetical protein GHCLOJNM_02607 [bacterium]|nr:hypothetical protein [bacterium]